MSADSRKVSTDALETLGTIITKGEKRDAIHLAVIPVEAGQYFDPSVDVGIREDGKAYATNVKLIGIVDPFLKARVDPGQWFWLVIYPRQITSLRHAWTHPDIPETIEEKPPKVRRESEQWIRDFLVSRDVNPNGQPDGYDDKTIYECVLKEAVDQEVSSTWGTGESLNFGFEIYGDIPPEFWQHVENVTGKKIEPENQAKYFRCAC